MLLLLFPDAVKVGGVQVVGRYWRSLKTSGSCERLDPVSTTANRSRLILREIAFLLLLFSYFSHTQFISVG